MASIQISGLASGINWTNIVNELVQADSAGVTQVQNQQATVNSQISALGSLSTDMNSLSSAIFTLESPELYNGVTAASTTPNSSWTVSAQTGTPIGNYTVDVSNLATNSQLNGAPGISAPLNSGGDAVDIPLASLPTADPITPGTFTINGQQYTVTTGETLAEVFDSIATATGGAITGTYNTSGPNADEVTLSSDGADLVLGAGTDSSNFLQALGLSSNGGTSVTSSSPLPAVSLDDVPLGSLPTANTITPGTFTLNGQQYTITAGETLAQVLAAISTATSGAITGAYNSSGPNADEITLSSSNGDLVLGADNDTSNFLQALGLSNNGATSVTSASPLGAVQLDNAIANANLNTPITGLDAKGNGSFSINGVTINYNVNTASMSTLLGLINNSDAGVNASYDASDDSIVLANTSTGATGIAVSDLSGNLMQALGLTGSGTSFAMGENAAFKVNNGPTQYSMSNTLGPSALGIAGLSVTADTEDTQTIQVASDTSAVQTAIQAFITSFNALQSGIQGDSDVTVSSNGTVNTAVLSSNNEVYDWGNTLEMVAFGAGSGVGGAINSLNNLGIDFNGTTGQLEIKDSAQLQQALTQNPAAVAAFFQTAKTGFGSIMTGTVNDLINQNADEQQNLQSQSSSLGTQISTMQAQVAAEQQKLDTEFQAMETEMQNFESESQALTDMFSSSSSGLGNIASSVNSSTGGTSSTTGSTSTTGGTSSTGGSGTS